MAHSTSGESTSDGEEKGVREELPKHVGLFHGSLSKTRKQALLMWVRTGMFGDETPTRKQTCSDPGVQF